MIRVLIALLVTTLQSRREEVGGIGTDLAAKKIERVTKPEVDVLLNDLERNAAELAHVAFLHQLRGATADAAQTRIADKHVMRFFGKHREREEVEPVVAWLIERFENAWLVRIAAASFEQLVCFVTTVTTEVTV